MGRLQEMRSTLSAAIEMYHTMGMAFWLTRAEATLARAEGCREAPSSVSPLGW
jgi:hypothetical protein